MSWFSKVFKNNVTSNGSYSEATRPDIPESVFVEQTDAQKKDETDKKNNVKEDNIHKVYEFLSKDYQQLGYDDALANPDTSNKIEKVKEIQGDLDVVIRKTKTFYEDAIRELDFLINSRGRLGMVDVVDELKMRKEKAKDHYDKVSELHQEAIEQGESHRLIISYKRGFQNGMAAIALHESAKHSF